MPRDTPLRHALALLAAESSDLKFDIEALATEVDTLCAEAPDADVGQLLSWRATEGGAGTGNSGERDAVHLATFHRSKGLEWKAVAVLGLEAGMVPISYAETRPALDEERRLLYVALTRAEDDLFCSWSERRTVSGRDFNCDPSPYLPAVAVALRRTLPVDHTPPALHISALRDALAGST
jgi:superfamily I DNA/RNA helicase